MGRKGGREKDGKERETKREEKRCRALCPPFALYALQYSLRTSGKGLEVENTDTETE